MPVDDLKQYRIIYTQTAEEDIFSKAEYMASKLHDRRLSLFWYRRLQESIVKDLSYFPYKFQVYDKDPWCEQGIRQYILRNDIILYSVDEDQGAVIIHNVYTRGKNLSEDLED